MKKLKITLTLTDAEAKHLVDTMKIGASHWFGAGLQRDAEQLALVVARRVDDAILARGRARRREDSSKLAYEYILAIGRASLAAANDGREFTEADHAAIRASFYPAADAPRASVTDEQRASNDQTFASLAEEAAVKLRQIRSKTDDSAS